MRKKLSVPEQEIRTMFANTDRDGNLTLDLWRHDPADRRAEPNPARFHMTWNEADRDTAMAEALELCEAMVEIGEHSPENLPKHLREILDRLIKTPMPKGYDPEEIRDIENRQGLLRLKEETADRLEAGDPVCDEEMADYELACSTEVTAEEEKLVDDFIRDQLSMTVRRIPAGIGAGNLICKMRGLAKLSRMGVPFVLLEDEARALARTLAVYRFADQCTEVVIPEGK